MTQDASSSTGGAKNNRHDSTWENSRSSALNRFKSHLEKGLIDSDIIELLKQLNKRECLFTTSSCSGRVALIKGDDLLDKKGASLLHVWHDPSKCRSEICSALDSVNENDISWLSLQPPILHIVARTRGLAEQIVKCGKSAGFKRSCYREHRSGGFLVEVAAYDKTHVFSRDCRIIHKLCDILEEYKERLEAFKECVLERVDCLSL
ncbi:MAG: hypothetical protein GSR77_04410 [Desulfurococcales archaeon]|nr:hypothetical protein [Desulfurococcales archaeon]